MIEEGQPLDVMIYLDHDEYLQKINKPITIINPVISQINVMNTNYQLDTYVMNNVHIDGRTYDDNLDTEDPNDQAIIISLTATNCVFTNCVFIIETFHQYILNFNGSFFENCVFEGNFDRADFRNTIFNNCKFNDLTHFNFCRFENSIIENSILVNIKGERMHFTDAKFYNVDLENAILRGSTFRDVIFKKVIMQGTETNLIRNANNPNKSMKYTTKFINTIFDDVNMQQCTFASAKLINVKMTKVDLYGSIMINCNLSDSLLNDVDLTDVTLDDAILTNTTMKNVNFTNTSLWNMDPIRDHNIFPNLAHTHIDNNTCYFMKNGDEDEDEDEDDDDDDHDDDDDDAQSEKIIFSNINRVEQNKLIKENIMNKSMMLYFDDLLNDREKKNIQAVRMADVFSKKFESTNLPTLPDNYLLDFFVNSDVPRRERIIKKIADNKKKIEKIKRTRIKKNTGSEIVSKSYKSNRHRYNKTGGKTKKTNRKTKKTNRKTHKRYI